ncbi:MAG: hypothetical protein ACK5SF_13430 [Hyphomonadaceae bacterium]
MKVSSISKVIIATGLVALSGCAMPFGSRSTVERDWSCRPSPTGPCRSMQTIDGEISAANPAEGGNVPASTGGFDRRSFQQAIVPGSTRSGERLLTVRVEGYADAHGVYHDPSTMRVVVTDPEWVRPESIRPNPEVAAKLDDVASRPLSAAGTRVSSGEVRLPAVDGTTAAPEPRRVSWFKRVFGGGQTGD